VNCTHLDQEENNKSAGITSQLTMIEVFNDQPKEEATTPGFYP
jgi:hypothetical protein